MEIVLMINEKEGVVEAKKLHSYARSIAKCHPNDTFDLKKGTSIAISRLHEPNPGNSVMLLDRHNDDYLKKYGESLCKYMFEHYVNAGVIPHSYVDRLVFDPAQYTYRKYYYDYYFDDMKLALLIDEINGNVLLQDPRNLIVAS